MGVWERGVSIPSARPDIPTLTAGQAVRLGEYQVPHLVPFPDSHRHFSAGAAPSPLLTLTQAGPLTHSQTRTLSPQRRALGRVSQASLSEGLKEPQSPSLVGIKPQHPLRSTMILLPPYLAIWTHFTDERLWPQRHSGP